jgi:hypothetical protein
VIFGGGNLRENKSALKLVNNVESNTEEGRRKQPQIKAEDRTRLFKLRPPTISGTQLLWPCDVPLITVKYLALAQSASSQNSCWKDSPAYKLIELKRYVCLSPMGVVWLYTVAVTCHTFEAILSPLVLLPHTAITTHEMTTYR